MGLFGVCMFETEEGEIQLERVEAASSGQAEVINRNLSLLAAEIHKIRERGSEINRTEVDAAIARLDEARRKLDESIAANPVASGLGNGDREIRRFLDADGKPVLLGRGDEGEPEGLLDEGVVATSEWHAELRRLVTQRTLVRAQLPAGPEDKSWRRSRTPKCDAALLRHLRIGPPEIARTFSGASGLGSDWAETLVAPTVIEALRLPINPVEDLFETIQMPSGTLTMPTSTTIPRAYRSGVPGSNPTKYAASDVATANRSLVSQGLAVLVPAYDDAVEDSVIAALPFIQRMMVTGLRLSTIDGFINGDTAASHEDTITSWNPRSIFDANGAYGGSDDPRKAFLGLRADAYDTSTTRDASSDTSFTAKNGTLLTAMAALKAPHGVSGELILLCSAEVFLTYIVGDANLITVDKYGPNATLLKGEVGKLYGRVTVVLCELVTADLAATGLYTGSGSYSGALLFNRTRFVVGVRRDVTSEVDRRASEGISYVVLTRRIAFKKVDATADKTCHWSFKL